MRGRSGYLPGTKIKKQFYKILLDLITEWVDEQPRPSEVQAPNIWYINERGEPTEQGFKDAWEITSWGKTEVRLTCIPGDGGRRHFFTVRLTEHQQ